MLQLENIHKTYQDQPLLDGISLAVKAGETVCLLGASGSGKSTLLRIIAGLEQPDAGRIVWNKTDLTSTPAHLRDFGLVFQDYALFPHLDVFSNAAFGLRMRSWPENKTQARVGEVLDLVNLKGFEARYITHLSGGEQQRVALARALAPRPRLLMFDEPLGALDRTLKEELLSELRAILHTTRVPAIYVTHDQEEAFSIADRILILHDGKIVSAGTPAQVVEKPGSAWVAVFLGLGNVLRGKIIRKKGRKWEVKTSVGVMDVECGADARIGDPVSVLIRPERVKRGSGPGSLKSRVSDVVYQKDGYRVTLENGLEMKLNRPPKVREKIEVRVEAAECLK